jgi:hypothetical protein
MLKKFAALAFVGLLATANLAHADTFSLQGTSNFSGQGFGTLDNLLILHHNGTESGSVQPTFSGSTFTGSTTTGDATNSSSIITAAQLSALGITTASQFGLLYNVNQEGVDLNTFIQGFEVDFYSSSGTVLFSGTYAGGSTLFPPVGTNGQGTSGYLFELNGNESFSNVAYIGMSGTVTNANDGADGWSVANVGGAGPVPTPEPSSLMLLGTGIIGAAGFIRRRIAA